MPKVLGSCPPCLCLPVIFLLLSPSYLSKPYLVSRVTPPLVYLNPLFLSSCVRQSFVKALRVVSCSLCLDYNGLDYDWIADLHLCLLFWIYMPGLAACWHCNIVNKTFPKQISQIIYLHAALKSCLTGPYKTLMKPRTMMDFILNDVAIV